MVQQELLEILTLAELVHTAAHLARIITTLQVGELGLTNAAYGTAILLLASYYNYWAQDKIGVWYLRTYSRSHYFLKDNLSIPKLY